MTTKDAKGTEFYDKKFCMSGEHILNNYNL